MRSIEASGKTVKDAVDNGLAQLGCDRDDVEMQVLQMNTTGLFGMFAKPAKVLLTVKEKDSSLDIEMPVLSLDGGARKAKAEKRKPERPKAEKAEKPAEAPKARPEKAEADEQPEEPASETEEAPRPEKRRRNRRRKGNANRESAEAREAVEAEEPVEPAPIVEREPFVPTPAEDQSDTAKHAREFLSGLTERMGVPVAIELQETGEQLRMQMAGENMSLLIGRRGETLDALQYLTSLTVNRGREDYLRVSIDTENYRAKREEALRKLAVRMAGRAKKSGRRVALEPMNPYERRILHSALQNDPDVTTHSEGEEPYRRVIITLK